MVSIAAFQAVDPGSIPGRRISYIFVIQYIFFHFIVSKSGIKMIQNSMKVVPFHQTIPLINLEECSNCYDVLYVYEIIHIVMLPEVG